MNKKIDSHIIHPVWGLTCEMKRNFEHLGRETWLQICGRMVLIKKQTKSENNEICRDTMILYVEVVVKIWQGFKHFVT